MSFLIEFRQIAPRIAARTSFAPRAFSTSPTFRKIVPEAVKNATKTVDRAVSDKLVDGIEIGRMFPSSSSFHSRFLHFGFVGMECVFFFGRC